MSFLQSTFDLLRGVFTRSRRSQANRQHGPAQRRVPQQLILERENALDEPNEKCQSWLKHTNRPTKRKALEEIGESTQKRFKSDLGSGYSELKVPTTIGQQTDRNLMPPPATPLDRSGSNSRQRTAKAPRRESIDSISEVNTQKTKIAEAQNDYDMEAARRRAAATQLPANSGIWEPAEQDLFYHLAYRGFEPLLPKTWMVDFPTLPISLFAKDKDDTPLIELHRSSEFRAIKALRELIDVGKTVRDRALVASHELRSEPIIEKAASKYVKWGLKDIGLSSKQCVPVHAVVSMKHGQSTRDTIRELTVKMHKLSSRHREACDVLASVEQDEGGETENEHNKTRIGDDRVDGELQLPIIYGLMICSSLMAIFTLSSHTPSPAFVARAQHAKDSSNNKPYGAINADDGNDNDYGDDEDSGLRFIASFDFSDSAADVWNALVIAIVAMMVRKSLTEIYDLEPTNNEPDFDESILDSSLIEGETEADRDRYQANCVTSSSRRVGTGQGGSTAAPPHGREDPDL